MSEYSYLHVLDGRIRIKVPEVKGDRLAASKIERALQSAKGVTHVKANPTTGNVLILFESDVITQQQIIRIITGSGYSKGIRKTSGRPALAVDNHITDFLAARLAEAIVQTAIERLIFSVI